MSYEEFNCNRCGARFGIAGEHTGDPEDFDAEQYFASEVEFHQSGECTPAAKPAADGHRARYIAGLRGLADLLEHRDDLPLPVEDTFSWNVWPISSDDVKTEVARIRRLLPGRFNKNEPTGDYNQRYFTLTAQMHGITLQIVTYRDEVCRRVVTGTREVTRTVPAPGARTVEITETVEDVEWVCEPLLTEAADKTDRLAAVAS